ncbi:MAG: hypothetical protein SFT93_01200 [Rickettsiaceae bacterium]|nr:hypothetical protein [Rickettsiaceae bacterium]
MKKTQNVKEISTEERDKILKGANAFSTIQIPIIETSGQGQINITFAKTKNSDETPKSSQEEEEKRLDEMIDVLSSIVTHYACVHDGNESSEDYNDSNIDNESSHSETSDTKYLEKPTEDLHIQGMENKKFYQKSIINNIIMSNTSYNNNLKINEGKLIEEASKAQENSYTSPDRPLKTKPRFDFLKMIDSAYNGELSASGKSDGSRILDIDFVFAQRKLLDLIEQTSSLNIACQAQELLLYPYLDFFRYGLAETNSYKLVSDETWSV